MYFCIHLYSAKIHLSGDRGLHMNLQIKGRVVLLWLVNRGFTYKVRGTKTQTRLKAPVIEGKVELRQFSSYAQMAELVDALVSNTSGFTSMPVRSRLWVLKSPDFRLKVRAFIFLRDALKVYYLIHFILPLIPFSDHISSTFFKS